MKKEKENLYLDNNDIFTKNGEYIGTIEKVEKEKVIVSSIGCNKNILIKFINMLFGKSVEVKDG